MVIVPTRERVIFALVRKDGQLNKELIDNANTNHNSLSIVLKGLKHDNIIVKDKENKYWFSTKLGNRTLKALGSSYTMAHSLDRFLNDLENDNEPVKKSVDRIAEIIKLLIILKLERYGTSKLSKRDKLEFELYFDIFDWVLGLIFDILRKKDPKKTEGLKISMISLFSKNNK